MLVFDEKYKSKIIHQLKNNTLTISFVDTNIADITEENIVAESMTLKQSICDEGKLKFGGCIASEFSVQLLNTENRIFSGSELAGKEIIVKLKQVFPSGDLLYPDTPSPLYPSNDLYPGEVDTAHTWIIFRGYIDTAARNKEDRNVFEVVAYDPIAKLYNINVSGKLYKAMKNNTASMKTLLPICSNLIHTLSFQSLACYSTILRNYDWEDDKSQISAGELLTDLCEIAGVYGFYSPGFNNILIKEYPHTWAEERYSFYENLSFEDNKTQPYDGVLFPYAGNLKDKASGEGEWGGKTGYYNGSFTNGDSLPDNVNYYDLSENILAWDYRNTGSSGQNDLGRIQSIYSGLKETLKNEIYYPFSATLDARLWVEVGDYIIVEYPETNVYGQYIGKDGNITDDVSKAKINSIKSLVLSRTITGIKALTDTIEAKGE